MNVVRRIGSKLRLQHEKRRSRNDGDWFSNIAEEQSQRPYGTTSSHQTQDRPPMEDSPRTIRKIPGAPPSLYEECPSYNIYDISPREIQPQPVSLSQEISPQRSRRIPGAPPAAYEEINVFQQSASGSNSEVPIFSNEVVSSGTPPTGAGLRKVSSLAQILEYGGREVISTNVEPKVVRKHALNPYEDLLREADAQIESLQSSTSLQQSVHTVSDTSKFTKSQVQPESCVVCTEEFSATVRPPAWISLGCLHEPSTCTSCISKSIRSDLDNKIWNQIKCPECDTLLIYEDVRRFADPETCLRYETLSFRSAVGCDENFIWCQNCDFGQLHTSGASQPIVRCMQCSFRSCFRHSVPWHDRLTCEEYDQMLQDPDGFQSAVDKDDAVADAEMVAEFWKEANELAVLALESQKLQAEKRRQKLRHEEELRRARLQQEVEAERRKEGAKVKLREEMRRKLQEEQLSLKTVHATTKKCPGCSWLIEKNAGCDHMTCIKCLHEFCWDCLSDYNDIRRYGNSKHVTTCRYHTNNLPS